VHERNLLDKFPKVSIDDVKKKIKELSDLKKLSEDMKAKKDEIMKSVQDKVKTESKEQTQEQYTDEDKTKLKDILKTF
jgi:hypothetical protein